MPNLRVPANAASLPWLTRRNVLLGIAAASASAGVSVDISRAAGDPNAELIALMRTFDRAVATYETAQRYYNDCERRYFALRPKPPVALTIRGPLGHLLDDRWSVWRAAALRRMLNDPDQSPRWSAARSVLPLARAYEAEIRVVKRKTDVAAAEAAHNVAINHMGDVSEAILVAPARGLAGLAVKARVVRTWGRPDWWGCVADTAEGLAARIIDL